MLQGKLSGPKVKKGKKKPLYCPCRKKTHTTPPTNIGKLMLCGVYGGCRCSLLRDLQVQKWLWESQSSLPHKSLSVKQEIWEQQQQGEICQSTEGKCCMRKEDVSTSKWIKSILLHFYFTWGEIAKLLISMPWLRQRGVSAGGRCFLKCRLSRDTRETSWKGWKTTRPSTEKDIESII